MIELALGIPVFAMIAMIALARLERSLEQATAEPEPARPGHPPRAAGSIRVRRSGQLWVLGARSGVGTVRGVAGTAARMPGGEKAGVR